MTLEATATGVRLNFKRARSLAACRCGAASAGVARDEFADGGPTAASRLRPQVGCRPRLATWALGARAGGATCPTTGCRADPRLLSAPRGQRPALVGGPELVQAAKGLAVDDDVGEAREPGDTDELGFEFWVLCQIDLFERYAPLRKQRLRVDAEGARASGEEDDAARHVDEYKKGRFSTPGAQRRGPMTPKPVAFTFATSDAVALREIGTLAQAKSSAAR